jgi:hypothetical protein
MFVDCRYTVDRVIPVCRMGSYHRFNRAGRAGRHGFVCNRHGTLSLYAAAGYAIWQSARQDRRAPHQPGVCGVPHRGGRTALAREVHLILDNLSAHNSQVVRDLLATHPNVHFHFTNQVEIWFSKVERDVIARGIFTSVKDLARKLRRYINAYAANAKPIQWKYSDPTRRIRSNVVSATRR